MNKCQESLDYLKAHAYEIAEKYYDDSDSYYVFQPMDNVDEVAKPLQELVNKVTPMKVIHDNKHGSGIDCKNVDFYNCPRCRRRLRNKQHDNYCGRCGQKLEWSD